MLKDVTFRVNSGETVALVGPTGSGKSSSMALIHRFYDVQDGAVFVGGRDVRDVTQKSLGSHIAMVLQEPYLFTGTVRDNIRYASDWADDAAVVEAAIAVGAHDFIEALPQGYGTILAERGSNLSLGQRQLISFARALVSDAKILIMDEATANIDSYTEMQIQKALQRLAGRAHRVGHRPSARHYPECGPHHRAAAGSVNRARRPRYTCRSRWPLRKTVSTQLCELR